MVFSGKKAIKYYFKSWQRWKRYEVRFIRYLVPPDRVKSTRSFEFTGVNNTGAITITGDQIPLKSLYLSIYFAFTTAIQLKLQSIFHYCFLFQFFSNIFTKFKLVFNQILFTG